MMVEYAKHRMPSISTGVPMWGMVANTAFASVAPLVTPASSMSVGLAHSEDTMTSAETRQMTTVHQNGPVMATSAWRAGFFDSAAALMSGAVPRPASLENRPRAQPNCSATMMPLPTAPPNAAFGVKAHSKMRRNDSPK